MRGVNKVRGADRKRDVFRKKETSIRTSRKRQKGSMRGNERVDDL